MVMQVTSRSNSSKTWTTWHFRDSSRIMGLVNSFRRPIRQLRLQNSLIWQESPHFRHNRPSHLQTKSTAFFRVRVRQVEQTLQIKLSSINSWIQMKRARMGGIRRKNCKWTTSSTRCSRGPCFRSWRLEISWTFPDSLLHLLGRSQWHSSITRHTHSMD